MLVASDIMSVSWKIIIGYRYQELCAGTAGIPHLYSLEIRGNLHIR